MQVVMTGHEARRRRKRRAPARKLSLQSPHDPVRGRLRHARQIASGALAEVDDRESGGRLQGVQARAPRADATEERLADHRVGAGSAPRDEFGDDVAALPGPRARPAARGRRRRRATASRIPCACSRRGLPPWRRRCAAPRRAGPRAGETLRFVTPPASAVTAGRASPSARAAASIKGAACAQSFTPACAVHASRAGPRPRAAHTRGRARPSSRAPAARTAPASPASITIHHAHVSMMRRARSQVANRLAQVPSESATGAAASA